MRFTLPTLFAALFAVAAPAQSLTYKLELSGQQEAPPVNTTGTGSATVVVDTGTGSVTVAGSYANMSSTVSAAHIHGNARRGLNAGVLLNLTTTGGTSGTFNGNGMMTPAQVQTLLEGLMYINVHTANHPSGELRAQIDSVPDSGSPGASPIAISGGATPTGSLNLNCPPTTNTNFILFGVSMAPGQTATLPGSIACVPGPVNVGVDLTFAHAFIAGTSMILPIPAGLPDLHVAFQCVTFASAGCVGLSGAARVAVRTP